MALKHLVVIVPGIGGSNLDGSSGELLWGHNVGATAATAFRPEALAISNQVLPTGLLRVFGVFPWSGVASYARLVVQLKHRLCLADAEVTVAGPGGVRNESASVVEFPYDFRQSMQSNGERLKDVVDAVRGDRKVIMVAHSMGGLVARWWWGVLGGHRICDGLITIGTPHRGAPAALDWLLNGAQLGPLFARPLARAWLSAAVEVMREWPSMYELLPRYQAIEAGGDRLLYPHELEAFPTQARQAYERHTQLEEACRAAALGSPGASVMAFYSTGHATPSRATVTGDRVVVSRCDPPWLPSPGWEGGDGTVPAISAIPLDRESVNDRCWAPQHHLKLVDAPQVVRHIAQFEQPSLGAVRGGEGPEGPWIGLAYDEVVAAGEPGSVGFALKGAVAAGGTATATLKLAPNHAERLVVVDVGEGGWRATLPALTPGSYEFTVALDHVPAVDHVEASSVIGVIEP